MVKNVIQHGIPRERVLEIPDWAMLESKSLPKLDAQTRALLGASDEDFLVVYSGNMGQKQGLNVAVSAAAQLKDEGAVKFALIGDGSDRAALETLIDAHRPGNLRLLPFQPPDVYRRVLASADALLLPQRPDVVDSVAPSKLLNYLAAGRPILAAVHPESTAAQLVRDAGCGLVVAAGDPGALARGALALRDLDATARTALGRAGQQYVDRHFSEHAVLERWDELLEGAVRS
jgi:colanic acid biosynthesis glycosyl transferase WcaI